VSGPAPTRRGRLASRRELLGGALAAASASALVPRTALAATPRPGHPEAQILAKLLATEHKLSETYRQVLAAGVLNTIVAAEASSFLAQEQEHVGALERQLFLRDGAFSNPPAPEGKPITTAADALGILIDAESAAERDYYAAISQLRDPELVSLATEILASEAQHWTLLSLLAHNGNPVAAVPDAFVDGSS